MTTISDDTANHNGKRNLTRCKMRLLRSYSLNEIASSHCLHKAEWTQLQQGFATGEMGFRDQLQHANSEPLMSALCQKLTSKLGRVFHQPAR